MYSGILNLKAMGGKGGSSKEKVQQKQRNSSSDCNLPIDEIVDLKNSLLMFNKSMKNFCDGAQEASCTLRIVDDSAVPLIEC